MIEIASEFRKRSAWLLKIRQNPDLISALKIVYKNDPVAFIKDWLITYDSERTPALIPFSLFPKQVEAIKFFHECNLNREDGLVVKTRRVGFTWLATSYSVWLWLFHPERKIFFGSRKRDLVDRSGDLDSIFEKIRLQLKYLPTEFLPKDFNIKYHSLFLRIFNPNNGSAITGDAGINIGRGGGSTIIFLDEHAHIPNSLQVEASISQNSQCKIYISTPNGVGNMFYSKRFSGKIKVFTFNWYDDPRKNKKWFDQKKETTDPVVFAQEILMDFGASITNITIPAEWVRAAINFEIEGIDTGSHRIGFDVAGGAGNGDKYAECEVRGAKVLQCKDWLEGNTTQNARKIFNDGLAWKVDSIMFDNIGVGAGVTGEMWSLFEKNGFDEKNQPFQVVGIAMSEAPRKGLYEDGEKKNSAMFHNLRAQVWWLMRRRFEKTYEHVAKIKQHPPEDLISIPDDAQLTAELSQPLFKYTEIGRIQIESKEEMKKRGVKSPNKADALMLAFTPFNTTNIRAL